MSEKNESNKEPDSVQKNQISNKDQHMTLSYVIEKLITEDKTVRDPVHGDILWNNLETCVIDTVDFQRLRRIRQLGTAHLVYPGAQHSRFEHSIGTLHMAQILLNCVRNNRFSQYRHFEELKKPYQDSAFDLIVRLAALLHDVQEFPLSHTLEKEGNIFPSQWKNQTFNVKVLGKDSAIFKAITNKIVEILGPKEEKTLASLPNFSAQEKNIMAKQFARSIIAYSYQLILGGKKSIKKISFELFNTEDVIEDLINKKFVLAGSQIVLDTVCADLLDYLVRDFYYCGIEKKYDERFLKYAVISDFIEGASGSHRSKYPIFAYNLVGKRKELRGSVLSSLFDTLELRYTLAEFVHTHRIKNAFSVMAIEAFNFFYQSLNQTQREELVNRLMIFGDDELLYYLKENNLTSRRILELYFKHKAYRECYICTNKDIEDLPQRINAINEHLLNARERIYLEKLLVELLNDELELSEPLKDGDLLIYVMPNPQRLFKELETNVRYLDANKNPKTGTLISFADTLEPYTSVSRPMRIIMERTQIQRNLLLQKFKNLWHISLFITPNVDFHQIQPLAIKLIESLFDISKCPIQINPDTPKSQLSITSHERLLEISKDKRSYKRFEDIYNGIRERSN